METEGPSLIIQHGGFGSFSARGVHSKNSLRPRLEARGFFVATMRMGSCTKLLEDCVVVLYMGGTGVDQDADLL